jgi:hypothetical protein
MKKKKYKLETQRQEKWKNNLNEQMEKKYKKRKGKAGK